MSLNSVKTVQRLWYFLFHLNTVTSSRIYQCIVAAYDRDKSGWLGIDNVAEVLAILGIAPDKPRIRDLLNTLDTNGEKKVSYKKSIINKIKFYS